MRKGDRTEEREVPHDPGNWFTFSNLSSPELDEADLQGTRGIAEQRKAAGLPDSALTDEIARRQAAGEETKPTPEQEFNGYHKATLVKYGVVAVRGPKCDWPCTPEELMKLDAKTMEWAARVVFEMNVRPLGEGSGSGDSSRRDGLDSTFPLNSPEPIESI